MDNNRDEIGRFIKGHSPLFLNHTEATKQRISKANETPISKGILGELYNKRKMSLVQISNKLNISRDTVSKYFHRHGFVLRSSESINKIVWAKTTNIAYILGVVFGDGSICHSVSNRGYIISLTTIDNVFARSFEYSLKEIGLTPLFYKDRCYFKVVAYSKLLYNFIKTTKIDHTKIKEYCKTDNLKIQFIKGFYESEGGDGGKGRGLRIFNTDKDILDIAQLFIFESLDITTNYFSTRKGLNGRKDVYILHIPSKFKTEFITKVKPVIKLPTERSWHPPCKNKLTDDLKGS